MQIRMAQQCDIEGISNLLYKFVMYIMRADRIYLKKTGKNILRSSLKK